MGTIVPAQPMEGQGWGVGHAVQRCVLMIDLDARRSITRCRSRDVRLGCAALAPSEWNAAARRHSRKGTCSRKLPSASSQKERCRARALPDSLRPLAQRPAPEALSRPA